MSQLDSKESLEVQTEDTRTVFSRIDSHTFSFRTEYDQVCGPRAGIRSSEFTISGPMWSVVVGESGKGDAWVVLDGKEIPLADCPSIFFIPPYSILEMRFERLQVAFRGIQSISPLPEYAPNKPTLFNITNFEFPENCDQFFNLLKARRDDLMVDRSYRPSAIAADARQYIYKNYESNLDVADICEALDVKGPDLTREFKDAFGLSPVKFRNTLRIQDSIRHLLFGGVSVTTAGFQVGFGDLSRFNKNFKSIMEAVPSQFTFRG